jgi:hypothetical protein
MNIDRALKGLTPEVNSRKDRLVMQSIAVNWQAVIEQSGGIGWQTECALMRFVGAEVCDQYRRSAEVAKRSIFAGSGGGSGSKSPQSGG